MNRAAPTQGCESRFPDEIAQQFLKLFAKIVRRRMPPIALECESDAGTGAGRAAHAQVDAPREQAAQH